MVPSKKTAIITGGASGMGLAVAQALGARGNWDIHVVDMNVAASEEVNIHARSSHHKILT